MPTTSITPSPLLPESILTLSTGSLLYYFDLISLLWLPLWITPHFWKSLSSNTLLSVIIRKQCSNNFHVLFQEVSKPYSKPLLLFIYCIITHFLFDYVSFKLIFKLCWIFVCSIHCSFWHLIQPLHCGMSSVGIGRLPLSSFSIICISGCQK